MQRRLNCLEMKINPDYKLGEIAGENLVVNQGIANVNMIRIISLNKSGSKLYKALSDKEFAIEDAAKVLMAWHKDTGISSRFESRITFYKSTTFICLRYCCEVHSL